MSRALDRERSDPRRALVLYYQLTDRSAMVLRRSLRLFFIIASVYGLVFALFMGSGVVLYFLLTLIAASCYRPRSGLDRNLGYLAQLGIARCYIQLGAPFKARRYLEVAQVERPRRLKALHGSTLAIIRGHHAQALAHVDRARGRHIDHGAWGSAWPYYRTSLTNTEFLLGAKQRVADPRGDPLRKGASTLVTGMSSGVSRQRPRSDDPTLAQHQTQDSAPTKDELLKEAFSLEPTRPHAALYLYNRVALKPERAKRKLALLFLLLMVPVTLGSAWLIFVFFGLVIVLLLYGEPHRHTVARQLAPLGAARCYLRTGQTTQANQRLNHVFRHRLPYLRPLYNATVSIAAGRHDQAEGYLKEVPWYHLCQAGSFYYRRSQELTRCLGEDMVEFSQKRYQESPDYQRWRRPAPGTRPTSGKPSLVSPLPPPPPLPVSVPNAVRPMTPLVSVIDSQGRLDPTARAGEPDPMTFVQGTRVYHPHLGAGTIQARFPHGREWRLRVLFDGSGEVRDVISGYITPLESATVIASPPPVEADSEDYMKGERAAEHAGPRLATGASLAPLPIANPITVAPTALTPTAPQPSQPQAGSEAPALGLSAPSTTTFTPSLASAPYQVEWLDLITIEAASGEARRETDPVPDLGWNPGPNPVESTVECPEPNRVPDPGPDPAAAPSSESWPVQWIESDVDDRMAELDQRLTDLTRLVLEPAEAPVPSRFQDEPRVEVETRLSHQQAQVVYQVKVTNHSINPIYEVKVALDLSGLQFRVDDVVPNHPSLASGATAMFVLPLEPTVEGANGTLKASLSYVDHLEGMVVERPIEAGDTGILWPALGEVEPDRKWREVTRDLNSHKERYDGTPLPPGVLFQLVCRILEDLNLRCGKPKLIQTSSFYSGRGRFMARDEAGRSYGVQAEVVGGPLRTRILLRVYAPCQAAIVGLFHLVREELMLRLEVGAASDPVVYQVNGDFIEGSKTEVRDSVVNRWAAGSEA